MIVNPNEQGWEVIYQRNHAMLATALAAAWQENIRYHPPRLWAETLVAIAQHDDEENFWSEDRTHLSDVGAPLDFTQVSGAVALRKARSVTNQARRQHRWISVLIARHHLHIYQHTRKDDPDLDAFLDEQAANIDGWLENLEIDQGTLERNYAVMRWCDRLSLILCKGQVPGMDRALDITTGPDGEMHRIWQDENDILHLSPWVFHQDTIHFDAEARLLTEASYTDGENLRAALDAAEVYTRQWYFERD